MSRPRTRASRAARIRAVIALVVLGGVGVGVVAAAGADRGPSYRLATASTQRVEQTLDEVGVVEPIAQASVAFPTSGTVATVDVAVGDTVAVGDVLATLDPASLQRALNQATSTLAQAELRLERALNGEDVGGGSPTGGSMTALSAGGEAVEVELVAAAVTDDELRAAQEAVLAAQRQVTADLAAADEALADASALCTWSEGDGADDTAAIQACRDALDAVLAAQQAVAASQAALVDAAAAYDALLAERAEEVSTPPTTTPTTTPSIPPSSTPSSVQGGSSGGTGAPSGGTGGSSSSGGAAPSGSGSTSTSSSPSSADLIAYQADVDAAAAAVTVAEQAISQATIVSPMAGTVVSVGIEAGDDVTAASADQAIAVAGDGGYEVTATVSVTDLPDLEVGQAVTVVPDGSDTALDGEIVRIGVVASDGATSYPVTVALTEPLDDELRNGAIASVAITTAGAGDVLAVPTSAVTVDGDQATVTIYDGTGTEEVTVEIGAIGSTWTEIRSGLDEGQQVVLADLDAALPGSATEGGGTGGGGTGGGDQVVFPGGGGGFGGGGFGGPPGG